MLACSIVGCGMHALNEDIFCRVCDYNLRGLRSGGRCPECGADIHPSLEESRHDARISNLVLPAAFVGYVILNVAAYVVSDPIHYIAGVPLGILLSIHIPISVSACALLVRLVGLRARWVVVIGFIVAIALLGALNLWIFSAASASV